MILASCGNPKKYTVWSGSVHKNAVTLDKNAVTLDKNAVTLDEAERPLLRVRHAGVSYDYAVRESGWAGAEGPRPR